MCVYDREYTVVLFHSFLEHGTVVAFEPIPEILYPIRKRNFLFPFLVHGCPSNHFPDPFAHFTQDGIYRGWDPLPCAERLDEKLSNLVVHDHHELRYVPGRHGGQSFHPKRCMFYASLHI